MEKAYQNLDIQFLPDNIVSQLNQEKLTSSVSISVVDLENNLNHMISTEWLSKNDFIPTDLFLTKLHFLTDSLTTFFLP